ncbi:hypothetical protein PspLS_11969, partial [Pyricularia sp. CBS 133598]
MEHHIGIFGGGSGDATSGSYQHILTRFYKSHACPVKPQPFRVADRNRSSEGS